MQLLWLPVSFQIQFKVPTVPMTQRLLIKGAIFFQSSLTSNKICQTPDAIIKAMASHKMLELGFLCGWTCLWNKFCTEISLSILPFRKVLETWLFQQTQGHGDSESGLTTMDQCVLLYNCCVISPTWIIHLGLLLFSLCCCFKLYSLHYYTLHGVSVMIEMIYKMND